MLQKAGLYNETGILLWSLGNDCHVLFEKLTFTSHNTHLIIGIKLVHEIGSCSSYSFPTITRRSISRCKSFLHQPLTNIPRKIGFRIPTSFTAFSLSWGRKPEKAVWTRLSKCLQKNSVLCQYAETMHGYGFLIHFIYICVKQENTGADLGGGWRGCATSPSPESAPETRFWSNITRFLASSSTQNANRIIS